MKTTKPRVIQYYEKLSEELQEQLKLVYPDGFSEHLIDFTINNGEFVTALPFEASDKIYMIRMSKSMAVSIIREDNDYDRHGNLKDSVKTIYEDRYKEEDYLIDNENYTDE